MGFDVTNLFGNLFGGTVPTVAAMMVQPEAVPEPIPGPEAADLPTSAVDTEWAEVVEVPDFDSFPLPGNPCPVCGSLEEWTDLLGRQRCGVCERATLDKALQLADRAARLRQQSQQRKPAPTIAPGCVSGGMVDALNLGRKRPLQSQPAGFGGA